MREKAIICELLIKRLASGVMTPSAPGLLSKIAPSEDIGLKNTAMPTNGDLVGKPQRMGATHGDA